ncbi:MAG TPA: helix-turn-helix transcriptional regulator [Candidatus Binataceae bacterium]|nr:helix-turn-helix transcriptional regulator [Candidatus Binataceae bacterium]
MESQVAPLSSGPPRAAMRDGAVRVHEFRCTASAGDPPFDEQFQHTSIAIVRSGVFEVRSRKRAELLTTGFLLIGNAGQPYQVTHQHAGHDVCTVFNFDDSVVEEMAAALRRGAASEPFWVNVLAPRPRADALIRMAEERLVAGAPAIGLEELGLALAEYALGEAGGGAARERAHSMPESPRARERVLATIAEIEMRAHEDLDLSGLAALAGVSPFHFVRMFRRETGVTPYRFIVQTRIRNAIEYLRDTAEPITDIAYDVGFGDLSNFINTFRREVGCSPGEYRNGGAPLPRASLDHLISRYPVDRTVTRNASRRAPA